MTYITIELTEAEAEQFVAFQKHYSNFMRQLERGVFDLSPGRAVLDFNPEGDIKNIRIENSYHYN